VVTAAVSEPGARLGPGNVRELKTALRYALVLCGDALAIEFEHLPADVVPHAPARLREGYERQALDTALAGSHGSEAARQLGVARTTLYRVMKRHPRG
jgi:sigma-54 dependent transcriptional regulator, acetoin dehydrogenase operon transcriptional activator AcoR